MNELNVMRSYNICVNAAKSRLIADITDAATGGRLPELTKRDLATLIKIIESSIDISISVTGKQMQAACK